MFILLCISFFLVVFFTAPEGPPTAINITNFGPYDLTITWEPPLVPNGIISTYSFYVTSENGEAVVYRVDGRLTSYVVMNLSPYSLVSVNMSASTSAGEGPQSAAIEMRTAQAGILGLDDSDLHIVKPS